MVCLLCSYSQSVPLFSTQNRRKKRYITEANAHEASAVLNRETRLPRHEIQSRPQGSQKAPAFPERKSSQHPPFSTKALWLLSSNPNSQAPSNIGCLDLLA